MVERDDAGRVAREGGRRECVDEVKGGVVRFGGRYLPASTGQPLETLLRRVIRGAA